MVKKTKVIVKKETSKVSIKDYAKTLADLKKRIQEAQVKSILAANKELIKLYWSIGETIVQKQEIDGWGSKTIEQLCKDLQSAFPGMAGFSRSNVFYMRNFYLAYEKVQQAAGLFESLPIFNIPWFHNVILITKLKNNQERLWYAQKAIENGWSRSMLEMWIESDLHKRQGKSITNFKKNLPERDSDIAEQALKDPYIFDFLTLDEEAREKEVEKGLMEHMEKFLLEMGKGFAFLGRQYHLKVGDQDLYIDMLFYHLEARCFLVLELKAKKFDSRDLGQMSLYISAVDSALKHPSDKPTIGLLLCKSKDNIVAEYTLRNMSVPIGISSYTTKLVESLPKELKDKFPTIKEIQEEFAKYEILQKETVKRKSKNAVAKKSKK